MTFTNKVAKPTATPTIDPLVAAILATGRETSVAHAYARAYGMVLAVTPEDKVRELIALVDSVI